MHAALDCFVAEPATGLDPVAPRNDGSLRIFIFTNLYFFKVVGRDIQAA
jgi:hypothetical protein